MKKFIAIIVTTLSCLVGSAQSVDERIGAAINQSAFFNLRDI